MKLYKNALIRGPPFQDSPEEFFGSYEKIYIAERKVQVMKMPNATETIERLAREAEARKILDMLERECKDIEEARKKVRDLLTK